MPLSRDDDLLMVAELTVRHLAAKIAQPPQVFPGVITSTLSGVGQFLQDGAKTTVAVTNKIAAANVRALVQFNPSGSAFVLQTI